MIKNVLLLINLLVSSLIGFSQSGSYMVSKHIPTIDQYNVYYGGSIDNNGVLYLATRNGIIKYDGRNSNIVNTGNSVFDIAIGSSNELYLGTSTGMYQLYDEVGVANSVRNITSSIATTPIFDIIKTEDGLYGLADKTIYYKSLSSDSTIRITDNLAGKFFDFFELDGRLFVSSENKGTLELDKGGLSSSIPEFLENQTVVFTASNEDGSKSILGNELGELFIFSSGELSPLIIEQQAVIDAEPITGLWYDVNTIVIGTLTGGVFFINTETGQVEQTIDYNSGLDDNEVVSLLLDKNKGVTVVGNTSIVHISPQISIRSFEYYEGLSGDISSTGILNQQLYVGTNIGLYRLTKITVYEEVVSFRNKKLKVARSQLSTRRKRRRWRKANKNKKTELTIDSVVTEKITSKVATASYYQYKEVDPQISNVTQIIPLKDRIIVSGLSGVFEIDNESVQNVSNADARYTYLSKDQLKLFICTVDDEVLVYVRSNGRWIYKNVFTDFRAHVSHIVEFENAFWFTSPNEVFEMKILANELDDVEAYKLENPYYSDLYSLEVDNKLRFISDNSTFKIQFDSLLKQENFSVRNIIIGNQNEIWTLTAEGDWVSSEKGEGSPIFSILGDLKAISYDEQSSLYWVVAEGNKIFNFAKNAIIPTSAYAPFMEETGIGISKGKKNEFVISQERNDRLSFNISNSDLPKIFDIKYRHKLAGLDMDWSDWTSSSKIDYNFLPDGKYELMVEATNAFGESFTIDSIPFKVLPPYWQRPWFYALEFGVVLFLFLVSVKLKSSGYKYRLLSRLLAFLTLVIVIEYLEAIMESYFALENSPIFGFVLQVLMAIIILPFEGLLKKYVFKENIKLGSYFEIKEKGKEA